MMKCQRGSCGALALGVLMAGGARAEEPKPIPRLVAPRFEAKDVFELEWAASPEISPDGQRIVYERHSMDVMTDRRLSALWMVGADGREHRPLGSGDAFQPRWSPDGSRLLYAAREGDSAQLFVRYMDSGQTVRLTHVRRAPNAAAWSPDGRQIAFTMLVPAKTEAFATLPDKPEGATWADPPKVIQKLVYRADGEGYLENGFVQLFLLPAEGGTPRQLTTGDFNVAGRPVFTPDGRFVLFSSNRRPDSDYEPNDSEIYELRLADGTIRALTDRRGPDFAPALSPDGRSIAYLGFDDRYQGYQVTHLYVMNRDGSGPRPVAADFDRDASDPVWSSDGKGLFFSTTDRGNGKVAFVSTAAPGEGRDPGLGSRGR